MNNSNFYTVKVNGLSIMSIRKEERRLEAFVEANNITLFQIIYFPPFVLNKTDATLLKLAGFQVGDHAKTIESMVCTLIKHDEWDRQHEKEQNYSGNIYLRRANSAK